jgi:hypothetical protein
MVFGGVPVARALFGHPSAAESPVVHLPDVVVEPLKNHRLRQIADQGISR